MPNYNLNINNIQKSVDTDTDTPLLYVLRDYLELNGPKFGCGLAQCGSCMVLINGRATTTCMLPVSSIGQSKITTLEGLTGTTGKLHAVQEAFVKEQAAQCGYCLNGMVMAAVGLLNKNPSPNELEIKKALELNLCRCGAHSRIVRAVKIAANSFK
ncbi:(2Fe-2S)-binding protein [Maribacter arcticus]|jgi:nicotinate dehydrogenase subunit A|uniref:Nicotinate dehydrogenase subunit A n=1 Tax=Maribacter arcticus TaxID=561365 RepID=A0A1T5AFF5_9FLAO|nr:(2Fe-2S)-binding protein [Maribacter arcticus]SKB33640.1 nicotinate dehydrogenase subunit A [Maribacter arcticus]|tara:strand:- start:4519 stop:4986 length:468 start_codon:yes stop_codon:yes gene_type:complete